MFGTNQQRPITDGDGLHLEVQDVFHTLQGEGPFSLQSAIFVRLAGCNLACHFCDTDFESAYGRPGQGGVALDELLQKIYDLAEDHPHTHLVVLTGGEPMRQNVGPLIAQLALGRFHFHVQVETAGTIAPIEDLTDLLAGGHLTFVVSPKTPRVNFWYLDNCKHWKYIVKARDSHPFDGLPYHSTQVKGPQGDRILAPLIMRPDVNNFIPSGSTIWVSPCDEQDTEINAQNLKHAVNLALTRGYRLSLQTHKILGLP